MGGTAFCVLCAAMAAGLTVVSIGVLVLSSYRPSDSATCQPSMRAFMSQGLMSLDPLELEVKRRVGTEKERAMASRVRMTHPAIVSVQRDLRKA
eukprot:9350-Eustigmatos_ZCMA.PRE.1